jgi:hypothetical protein
MRVFSLSVIDYSLSHPEIRFDLIRYSQQRLISLDFALMFAQTM